MWRQRVTDVAESMRNVAESMRNVERLQLCMPSHKEHKQESVQTHAKHYTLNCLLQFCLCSCFLSIAPVIGNKICCNVAIFLCLCNRISRISSLRLHEFGLMELKRISSCLAIVTCRGSFLNSFALLDWFSKSSWCMRFQPILFISFSFPCRLLGEKTFRICIWNHSVER